MKTTQKIIWLSIFSITMGYMEAAIVVYLRVIYYPDGFHFPLVAIDPNVALVEFLREAATVIMLLSIGVLAGRTISQRFAFFLFCFAVWDIFYYVFLKLLVNWPDSFLTWDILFLIPVPWVGPVLAPCIVASTMIVHALLIVYYNEKGKNAKISAREWVILSAGSLVIIFSFTLDYFKYVGREGGTHMWTLGSNEAMFSEIHSYVPGYFNWLIFLAGEFTVLAGIILYALRLRSALHPNRTKEL